MARFEISYSLLVLLLVFAFPFPGHCKFSDVIMAIKNFKNPADRVGDLRQLQDPFKKLNYTTRAMQRESRFDFMKAINLYEIPVGVDLDIGLKVIIEFLHEKVKENPDQADFYYLMIGDAEHWLGHDLESMWRWSEGWQAHVRSLEAYSKTKSHFSPFIHLMHVREHAKSHLTRLYTIADQKVPEMLKFSNPRYSDQHTDKTPMKDVLKDFWKSDWQSYMARIKVSACDGALFQIAIKV